LALIDSCYSGQSCKRKSLAVIGEERCHVVFVRELDII